ncbi:MAG TPA: RsmB/NOP family class I SAM-dependent RNA methyltransferase [Aliiroseovarius sp.]|nr:RsmB/NOP family class I SAM-dependent RNA methyltransferase [Aliiroseovarius sp.]
MTPEARIAAAIELLDSILGGAPAEQSLTRWGRAHRYAGSKDRAAIRDHVFDALRCRRSFAALGGGETGRGLMIGALRAAGDDPTALFTGQGYAPAPLEADELAGGRDPDPLEALDCPDWLAPHLQASLGDDFPAIMETLRHRAPVFLRVNLLKANRDQAQTALAEDAIVTRAHPLSPTALEVTENARRVRNSEAFQAGLVELQDVASQAIMDRIPLPTGAKVLDFCAGGGGKTLALAGRGAAHLYAHDANPARLRDLPKRAARAGADLTIVDRTGAGAAAPFDIVLADVPCSGSGAWRRSPDAKWDLTAEKLDELCAIQAGILDEIVDLTAPDGMIAYATCSLLEVENQAQTSAFLARHPEWKLVDEMRLTPLEQGDGFYLALLKR